MSSHCQLPYENDMSQVVHKITEYIEHRYNNYDNNIHSRLNKALESLKEHADEVNKYNHNVNLAHPSNECGICYELGTPDYYCLTMCGHTINLCTKCNENINKCPYCNIRCKKVKVFVM